MKTVLIVCHANTARSVMAQVMLERLLRERQGCCRRSTPGWRCATSG
jgi:protein-tyrosine-phosphatase